MSYDMIDRFLRNNLGDDDYAEYSAALDSLCTPQPKQEQGEPVAEVKRNSSGQIYIEWRDGESAIANLIDAKLYTTPQPAQKPLTEEQIRTQFCGKPENFWDYNAGVRYAEAAHGIKE
jgi:hypothetical protein